MKDQKIEQTELVSKEVMDNPALMTKDMYLRARGRWRSGYKTLAEVIRANKRMRSRAPDDGTRAHAAARCHQLRAEARNYMETLETLKQVARESYRLHLEARQRASA